MMEGDQKIIDPIRQRRRRQRSRLIGKLLDVLIHPVTLPHAASGRQRTARDFPRVGHRLCRNSPCATTRGALLLIADF